MFSPQSQSRKKGGLKPYLKKIPTSAFWQPVSGGGSSSSATSSAVFRASSKPLSFVSFSSLGFGAPRSESGWNPRKSFYLNKFPTKPAPCKFHHFSPIFPKLSRQPSCHLRASHRILDPSGVSHRPHSHTFRPRRLLGRPPWCSPSTCAPLSRHT